MAGALASDLVERQVDGFHLVCIDPRPDHMGMAATFLLVEYDRARLIFQSELLFYLLNSRFKHLYRHTLIGWRAETEGEKKAAPHEYPCLLHGFH